jgi:hypothetical protein
MVERYMPTRLQRTLRFWLGEINAATGVPPWRDTQWYNRDSPLLDLKTACTTALYHEEAFRVFKNTNYPG